MTAEQLLQEFDALPPAEQRRLARALSRRLDPNAPDTAAEHAQQRRQTLARLHGILRGNGPVPSDQDIEKIRRDYLSERYG